jgi:hypothetical protein
MSKLSKTVLVLLTAVLITGCATKELPILAVRLSNDDGTAKAPITRKEISKWVNYANDSWEDAGYSLVFNGDDDIIDVRSSFLNTQPPDNAYDQWELYRIAGNYLASLLPPDRIPVYFRQKGSRGWSWGPGDTNFITLPAYTNTCASTPAKGEDCPNGCCPDTTLLSRVLGNYLGLSHTPGDRPTANTPLKITSAQEETIRNSLNHPWRIRIGMEE